MGVVGVQGCAIPLGHWFERFILVVERWFGIDVDDVWHRVDWGAHRVGSDASIFKVLDPLWLHKIAIFVGDASVRGASFVIGFKPFGARVHVIRYLELLLNAVFKLLDAGSLLVCFGESLDIAFSEGGHQASYDGSKHVFSEPFELVYTCLGGAWRKGDGRRLSHNGSKLVDSDGEGRCINTGGTFFR